ncbi:hypothetical protein EW146_g1372 [Bondarzewia mesenterica]|uniref:DNA helicase Pif1-like 2B domain-containing protein n=1 Tax=Bondarzewia mesenterica TaxID=1095465 RepID=A0A4S4M417_9AGAM|nr:hypothetical protein EW146_g1372 [Bondarzewia mesenterica]
MTLRSCGMTVVVQPFSSLHIEFYMWGLTFVCPVSHLWTAVTVRCLRFPAHSGDELLYYSSDALEESDTADAPELLPDYFSQLKQAGVPDHELTLKTGSICTIVRNLSVTEASFTMRALMSSAFDTVPSTSTFLDA